MSLFRTKPVQAVMDADAAAPGEATLKRVLTAKHLVLLGIGAVIGAGIFVLTGHAAANHAGPAVVLSFVIAGFACGLAGRSEEHTSELQSLRHLVCRLLLEKKKKQ